ncbi:MAG TPA: hydroxylamine reductase [Spirochaetota bacterium]|nr:hydroxylamine reductase [Spirochaetota bacterium]HPP04255.1 hydroxylamine reductase [Spirochaetota bacterium]
MFCFQCEQAVRGTGCQKVGVCGKSEEASILQDLIIHGLKSLSIYAKLARKIGIKDNEVDLHTKEALFTTVTNVDFDPERLEKVIYKTYEMKEKIRGLFLSEYKKKNNIDFDESKLSEIAFWKPETTREKLIDQGRKVNIKNLYSNEDVMSLKELALYGLKGMAAYADHAAILGYTDEEVDSFFYEALNVLIDESVTIEKLIELNMKVGEVNLKCMELLDRANTTTFGNPVPAKVFLGAKKGPAILVSGHDLLDLYELLKQTEGTGVNVYTHGEMLPAHGYPELKKFKHFVGNYGGAWQDQQKEFDQFPGAILMTTNCIQKPKDSYIDRIFTTGLVAYPNVKHLPNRKDFSKLIEKAKEVGGFKEDIPGKEIMVGFAHNAVLSVAEKVIDAVKNKKIRHFFLVGGCDGARSGRNYYTELAEKIPSDCLILTLACGKYRFNKLEFGEIEGIPRLLDVGQCNDAYSAIVIAIELAKAFNTDVNSLPLSLILSWYEQKAVCILLTLLSLGIKNIKLGPTLPLFVSKNVLDVLVKNFNIKPISTPEEDIKEALKD